MNMSELNVPEIQVIEKKLKSFIEAHVLTDYFVAQKTGLSATMLGKYRTKTASVSNMSLKNANKLLTFYKEYWLDKVKRIQEIIVYVEQPVDLIGVYQINEVHYYEDGEEISLDGVRAYWSGNHYIEEDYEEEMKRNILNALNISLDTNIDFEYEII